MLDSRKRRVGAGRGRARHRCVCVARRWENGVEVVRTLLRAPVFWPGLRIASVYFRYQVISLRLTRAIGPASDVPARTTRHDVACRLRPQKVFPLCFFIHHAGRRLLVFLLRFISIGRVHALFFIACNGGSAFRGRGWVLGGGAVGRRGPRVERHRF
eukprot:6199445-Pleurochrysis_carterae.AAC.2